MKACIGTLVVLLFVGVASAQSFEYRDGPEGGVMNTILYYEVEDDYSVDLVEKFRALHKLPDGVGGADGMFLLRPLGWKGTNAERAAIQQHVNNLANIEIRWDFIELVDGVLTVKKGYRWDGASTIGNDWNINDNKPVYLRGSCMHDSMYDLMRMGYLAHDRTGNANYGDPGFMNRLAADCLMHMLFKEDGEDTLINEFKFVRYGGAEKTQADGENMGGKLLLAPWKYHISRLRVWESEDGVEMKFLEADAAGKDPRLYGTRPHRYAIFRWENGKLLPKILGSIQDGLPLPGSGWFHAGMESFFTDTTAVPGKTYTYHVVSEDTEENLDWDDRHYDRARQVVFTVPEDGGGDPPPPPPPPPEVFAGDGCLYVAKGTFVVAWSKHARGQSRDSLTLIGCVGPAGMAADLSGATIDVKVGGVSLVGPIELDAKGRAKSRGAHRVSLSPKTGRFVVKVVGLDLRARLDVENEAGAGTCTVEVGLDIQGAGLAETVWNGEIEFSCRTREGKKTVGKHSFRKQETFTGAFVPMGVKVRERDGLVSLSMKGPCRGHGGGAVTPVAGDVAVTLTIGDADPIEIPFDALEVDGPGSFGVMKGAVSGLRKLEFDDAKRSFVLQADGLEGVGDGRIGIRIEVQEDGGPRIFRATVEAKRSVSGKSSS